MAVQQGKDGEVIRSTGNEGDSLLLLLKGRAEVGRGVDEFMLVDSVDEGHFFGEAELVLSVPDGYSLRCSGDCLYAEMPGETFLNLLREYSPFAQALAALFRDRRGIFQAFDRFRAELMRGVAFGHIEIDDLLPLYQDLEPALHPLAADGERIDFSALLYAVRRLPANISQTFALLLRDELPDVFDDPGEYLPVIPSMARRRSVWEMLPGKNLVLLRSGLSDLTDLISCLCLYASEVRKIRQRIYTSRGFTLMKPWLDDPENFVDDSLENPDGLAPLLREMLFSDEEIAELVQVWPGRSVQKLYDIGMHREMFSIDVRRQRSNFNSRRTEQWTARIAEAVEELMGTEPGELELGVHIISSNTHSVTNCLSPWYRRNADAMLAWADESGHSALDYQWNNRDDLLYSMARDYLSQHPAAAGEIQALDKDRGVVNLPGTLATGIEVQLIDLSRALGPDIDPRLGEPDRRGGGSRDLIVNIDYAFGEQAEHILRSLVLLFHRNIRSVNFIGKAGSLLGSRGDVLVPGNFIHQLGDEVQETIPVRESMVENLRASLGVDRVHRGPMVTVEGTLLQNRMMLNYYRRIWQAIGIEMEGSYYHHQVLESMRTGLLSRDIDQRYLYYVSDLPLGSGHNLSLPLASAEGLPPLYAITTEILRGIISG